MVTKLMFMNKRTLELWDIFQNERKNIVKDHLAQTVKSVELSLAIEKTNEHSCQQLSVMDLKAKFLTDPCDPVLLSIVRHRPD